MIFVIIAVATLNLGNDSYHCRESSSAILQIYEPLIWPYLDINLENKDLEIRNRIRRLINRNWINNIIILPDNRKILPWIDMLPQDNVDRHILIHVYLILAREKVKQQCELPFDDYREATRLMVKDLILNKVSKKDIKNLLNTMNHNEIEWWHEKK